MYILNYLQPRWHSPTPMALSNPNGTLSRCLPHFLSLSMLHIELSGGDSIHTKTSYHSFGNSLELQYKVFWFKQE